MNWQQYYFVDVHPRDALESDDEPDRVTNRTASYKAAAKKSNRHEDGTKKARRGKGSVHKRSIAATTKRKVRRDYVEGERMRKCKTAQHGQHMKPTAF